MPAAAQPQVHRMETMPPMSGERRHYPPSRTRLQMPLRVRRKTRDRSAMIRLHSCGRAGRQQSSREEISRKAAESQVDSRKCGSMGPAPGACRGAPEAGARTAWPPYYYPIPMPQIPRMNPNVRSTRPLVAQTTFLRRFLHAFYMVARGNLFSSAPPPAVSAQVASPDEPPMCLT